MKASFFKRMGAFILDYFIVIFIVSLITMGFNSNKTNDLTDKMSKLLSDYQNGEITIDEYKDETYKINYELQKSNLTTNIVSVTLYIGYFVVFATLNKGQTLGKKILKIKIEKIDGNLTIRDMVIRNFITTSLLQLMISSTLVYIVNNDIYYNLSIFVSLLQILLVIITSFMIIYRKDEKGVQDLITGTQVIEV